MQVSFISSIFLVVWLCVIIIFSGYTIKGMFKCNKNAENHRELDITIDYTVTSSKGEVIKSAVQKYVVR
jgi:hypothetical protein